MKVVRYVHEWSKSESNIFLHTFPMIHIGEEKYYKDISQMMEEMNHALIEGITVKNYREIGSYRKIAKAIGLTTQNESLKLPEDLNIQNIDMECKLFHLELNKLPIFEKIKLLQKEILLTFFPKKYRNDFRKVFISIFGYDESSKIDLINPEKHYAFTHTKKSKTDLLIENKRNEIIEKNIDQYISINSNREFRLDVAVIFGDAHMPYIYKKLKNNGYNWKLEKTLEVM